VKDVVFVNNFNWLIDNLSDWRKIARANAILTKRLPVAKKLRRPLR
jgi:hypothetical protein